MTDTVAAEPTVLDIRRVEQFLYREARLADQHQYDEWESLWTDDAVYWVPAGSDDADPMSRMSVIHDNRNRISTRLKQLRTGRRHAQIPQSRLCRVVSNVEILGADGADTTVEANFVLVESRERGRELWAGRYTYRLRVIDGELRMAYKKVALVDNAGVLPSLGFLI
ncbi:aromatic-ring-hydroxylating dioxygenase subunit beta [Pseudonocardia spinosispora]|uniref:aromatic-ring-hydroxylating dioxygenase subunit beta n=1 Tax=Pseudonocardia spinosispora TaxID=103441 RepID=UPI000417C4C4|nr:aromatic-ring-hydroxylating dioxygenase subunit beta [Pseudonocardia spinosispora]